MQKLFMKFPTITTFTFNGKNILKYKKSAFRTSWLVRKPLMIPNGYILEAKQHERKEIGITIIFCNVLFVSLENPAFTSS